MNNLSLLFLQYLRTKSKQITEEIFEIAKDCLCDYFAVTEAGGIANRERWENFCRHIPIGNTPLLGLDLKTDSKTACLVNGYNAHSLELDDGQRFAMIHLGASIITAINSVAADNNISERDLLTGIIIGYEAACRTAISIQPAHKKKGFHAAGTCGTIGSAIGVAYALNMNDKQLSTVLSAAVASAAGMLEIQEQSSELKPFNLGRAAMDGVSAAYMGYTDFLSPDDILGGERGFLNLFGAGGNPEKAIEKKDYFEIERIYVKPYAACRHCHSAIEAVLALRNACQLDDIEKIIVETYKLAVKGHDHTEISGVSSAKLSIPYSVSVAFVLGRADVSSFSANTIINEDILNLTKKIKVVENEDFSKFSPQKRIAKVNIYLKNGQILSEKIDYAKGDPENPMSRDDIKNKAVTLLGELKAEEIFKTVYGT